MCHHKSFRSYFSWVFISIAVSIVFSYFTIVSFLFFSRWTKNSNWKSHLIIIKWILSIPKNVIQKKIHYKYALFSVTNELAKCCSNVCYPRCCFQYFRSCRNTFIRFHPYSEFPLAIHPFTVANRFLMETVRFRMFIISTTKNAFRSAHTYRAHGPHSCHSKRAFLGNAAKCRASFSRRAESRHFTGIACSRFCAQHIWHFCGAVKCNRRWIDSNCCAKFGCRFHCRRWTWTLIFIVFHINRWLWCCKFQFKFDSVISGYFFFFSSCSQTKFTCSKYPKALLIDPLDLK